MSVTSTAPQHTTPCPGILGLETKAFSGRLSPAEHKGAESSTAQTEISLTGGQSATEGRSEILSKPFYRSDQLG